MSVAFVRPAKRTSTIGFLAEIAGSMAILESNSAFDIFHPSLRSFNSTQALQMPSAVSGHRTGAQAPDVDPESEIAIPTGVP